MSTEPVWIQDEYDQHLANWPGDPTLAEINRSVSVKPPKSRIVETNILATSYNLDRLDLSALERIVNLDCGHLVVTRNHLHCICPVCQDMIDRGADFQAYEDHLKQIGLRS